jgi:hypothetical protein
MGRFLDVVARHYTHTIVDPGKQPQVVILVSFLLTFLAMRGITHTIRSGRARWLLRNVSAGSTHIHHLVWGILLLLVSGYLGFAFNSEAAREPLAALFGAGAALTLDQLALWLNLEDVYWSAKGRRSIDAVIATSALLGLVLVGFRFWLSLGREVGHLLRLV